MVGEDSTPSSGARVLVVEDEVDDARFALDIFEAEGAAEVEVTPYGERALEILEDDSFDCVVLDYRLPRMDGAEFVRKAREKGLKVPIAVLTGQGSRTIEEELSDAGADAYLDKDKDDDQVLETVLGLID